MLGIFQIATTSIIPWYVHVQPIVWLMANHIKNRKAKLNFNEFGAYSIRKQANKLRAIAISIDDGTMLSSYTIVHTDAKFSLAAKN